MNALFVPHRTKLLTGDLNSGTVMNPLSQFWLETFLRDCMKAAANTLLLNS